MTFVQTQPAAEPFFLIFFLRVQIDRYTEPHLGGSAEYCSILPICLCVWPVTDCVLVPYVHRGKPVVGVFLQKWDCKKGVKLCVIFKTVSTLGMNRDVGGVHC